MPKISIIMPVYNVETFLRQCLDSILSQTFSDFELICINDGSTDSSLSILKEYEAIDERIRLFSKENEGYGKTMNLGLTKANAPYIGIIESDDFVKKEMFEVLYGVMQKHQVDVVKCNFYKYTTKGGMDIDYSHEYDEQLYGQVIRPVEYSKLYLAHSSIWAALYDRKFLEENNIRFNETPGGSFQDISFQFKILSSARRMVIVPEALLYYRTDNMMSSVYSPNKIYCICDEIHAIEEFIREQDSEFQERLWPLLMRRKYYDYRWNWRRLPMIFQFAFYEKMAAELKEDWAAGKFNDIEWQSPADQKEFNKMMQDTFGFFINTVKGYEEPRMNIADTINKELGRIGFYALLEKSNAIVIYGAGKVGRYVAEQLEIWGVRKDKLRFAVTNMQGMDGCVDDIPVCEIGELIREDKDGLILVSVKGEKLMVMLNHLKYLDCKNVVVMDEEVISYLKK